MLLLTVMDEQTKKRPVTTDDETWKKKVLLCGVAMEAWYSWQLTNDWQLTLDIQEAVRAKNTRAIAASRFSFESATLINVLGGTQDAILQALTLYIQPGFEL